MCGVTDVVGGIALVSCSVCAHSDGPCARILRVGILRQKVRAGVGGLSSCRSYTATGVKIDTRVLDPFSFAFAFGRLGGAR